MLSSAFRQVRAASVSYTYFDLIWISNAASIRVIFALSGGDYVYVSYV